MAHFKTTLGIVFPHKFVEQTLRCLSVSNSYAYSVLGIYVDMM